MAANDTHRPVLILGAAPRVSVPIARSLHRAGIPVEVASFLPGDPRLRSRAIRDFHRLPHPDQEPAEFIEALCALIERKGFDMLIPISDPPLAAIVRHYDRLSALLYPGCPPPKVVERVLNKSVTLEVAARCGIKVPRSFSVSSLEELEALAGELRFPVAVKPAELEARRFVVRYCHQPAELTALVSAHQPARLLVQEYCPGAGVGVEVLMHAGQPLAVFQHRRLKEAPASGGVAVMAIAEAPDPALLASSVDLLRALEWEGAAMVEYRVDREGGTAVLMEVNGRFWGTTSLPILAGMDFPLYLWQLAHGSEPQIPTSYRVGTRWRWSAGYLSRLHGVMSGSRPIVGPVHSRWRELAAVGGDLSPAIYDALWSWKDPIPGIADLAGTVADWAVADAKWILRRIAPGGILKERDICYRLGPKAGPIYAKLRAADRMRVSLDSRRRVPRGAQSFLFVCHGNIMRSPMAEQLLKCILMAQGRDAGQVCSAGLHVIPGHEADSRAQLVARAMGLSLQQHRAQPLSREMVEQADAIFAMDLQNKAELLARYPEARQKIFMLSAYAEGAQRYREIEDPFYGDEDDVRRCYEMLQTCVQNLAGTLWPAEKLAPSAAR